MPQRNILVVGAGPVGTVAALACARLGHTVTLLEAQDKVDDSPRASTTQPPTLEIIAELGLIDAYLRQGLVARTFQFWDRDARRLIAEFDSSACAARPPFLRGADRAAQARQHVHRAIEGNVEREGLDGEKVMSSSRVVSKSR